MANVNPNNGSETKSEILPWNMFKYGVVFFYLGILKYSNDFQNQHFSVL